MELRSVMEPVSKIFFQVAIPDGMNAIRRHREIRDWLGANCDCTWETIMNLKYIEVYFDRDAEKDASTFKMFWHGVDDGN